MNSSTPPPSGNGFSPPSKAHELESALPLITSYSWSRASSFDLHLALGLMEKEMQPLS